jgi:hypothetical protein
VQAKENSKLISVLVSSMKEYNAAYWTQQEKCMSKATSKANNPPKLRRQRSDDLSGITSPI